MKKKFVKLPLEAQEVKAERAEEGAALERREDFSHMGEDQRRLARFSFLPILQ